MTIDQFPEDPGITDIALIVEGKKMYTAKSILSIASPVFRAMFSSDFKERNANEIELPGKIYGDFEKFLMCLSPDKYLDLDDDVIEKLLQLAKEYQVNSIISKCETWLLKEMDLREAREESMIAEVEFLLKSFYYGSEYNMPKIRVRTLRRLKPFKLASYKSVKTYRDLPEKDKIELLECRIAELDSLHSYTPRLGTNSQCNIHSSHFH
ncbi:BTB and MATH domain-containing protein 38-like [Saccostrea cucullata]|uniref:BTB and MATH domain-containing protein 38-like n=1 Tax=Saccostrea cuccullata TaxID=36930 RepID=UPI002ED26762